MTVLLEGVTLEKVVERIQHMSSDGGAKGFHGHRSVSATTCNWSSNCGGKGSNEPYLCIALKSPGRPPYGWSGKKSGVVPKMNEDGSVTLHSMNESHDLTLLL
jgi:hypothetical protein